MARQLELPTGTLDTYSLIPNTATEAVYGTLHTQYRNAIADMLLDPNFCSADIPPMLVAITDTTADIAIQMTFQAESRRYFPELMPLTRLLGALAITDEEVSDLELSPTFIRDLHDQIAWLPYDFSELKQHHRTLSTYTGYLDLVREVSEVSSQTDDPEWPSKAWRVVAAAAEHPENFVVPAEMDEALYLIPFLPLPARNLTRRLTTGMTISARVAESLSGEQLASQEPLHAALTRYYVLEALTGSAWDNFSMYGAHIDKSVGKELAMLSAESLQVLGEIQRLTRARGGSVVAEAWTSCTNNLQLKIDTRERDSRLGVWQLVDSGHCFSGLQSRSLYDAFDLNVEPYSREFACPIKSGARAAILEDDPEQLALWQNTVNERTKFITDETLSYATPEGLIQLAEDASIELFLLDMQNHDDDAAGLRLGEEILRQRIQQFLEYKGNKQDAPRTKIVVWSTSSILVSQASDYIDPILKSLAAKLEHGELGFRLEDHSSSGTHLMFEVRDKRWREFSDTSPRIPKY